MSLERDMFRAQAKKQYKEYSKNVPKRSRMPFSEFFKHYKQMKNNNVTAPTSEPQATTDDFDVSQVVNVNKVEEPEK